ncbi:MAG: hypothetical protein ACYTX0_61700, partial [Nostoc sp.]
MSVVTFIWAVLVGVGETEGVEVGETEGVGVGETEGVGVGETEGLLGSSGGSTCTGESSWDSNCCLGRSTVCQSSSKIPPVSLL